MPPAPDGKNYDTDPVSVIIPYSPDHTPARFLEAAKQSVRDQCRPTEIIVVRDEEQRGPGWARNRGLERAETRFVGFLDADDRWMEGILSRQFAQMAETGNSVCIEGPPITDTDQFIKKLLLGNYPAPTSGLLIDTEVVQASFDEKLTHGEDHLFIIEAAVQGGICACSDLVEVRRHDASLTSEQSYNQEYVMKHYQLLDRVQQVTDLSEELVERFSAKVHYTGGRLKYKNGNYRSAIKHLSTSLKYRIRSKTVAALGMAVGTYLYTKFSQNGQKQKTEPEKRE
jgi:glycosyltransferase involved in cell wall biosynthesis